MILFELFYTFFLIGLFTFGGGYAMIPMIQEQVLLHHWADANAITDFIAISEITPGPFAINISTFIGQQTAGPLGALVATLGVILPSLIIIIIVAAILEKFIKNRFVKCALSGVNPIVISLILSTTIVLLIKIIFFNNQNIDKSTFQFDQKSFALLIMLGGFAIIYKLIHKKSLNPLLILLISAVLGLVIFII